MTYFELLLRGAHPCTHSKEESQRYKPLHKTTPDIQEPFTLQWPMGYMGTQLEN